MPQLSDFEGNWVLTRQILHADGNEARFDGHACFAPEGVGLHYCETGELVMPGGQSFHAERSYFWRAEGGQIAVAFEDGRPFHSFDPLSPAASHWCDPDDYRVSYDFDAWPRWRAIWRVQGPRKDYEMISDYVRSAGQP
ncbi:hypothetical protein AXZ77_1419 [Thioclava sp. ES.031]|uniref:DUF6314 family protein n=1 Tax=Thioclava sp. ES.031 TaxID=1798203 RepID=UPI000BF4E321|nr:DUF6314 family protein [Thioclava sp. ES.031]PFG62832.1 hypothetical protein AXZ77_1419 [Thioclava sp. ES.031]